MKRNNRVMVDQFLLALEDFITSNTLTEEEILDLILPIKTTKPSTYESKGEVSLPTIVELVNKDYAKHKSARRKEKYVRRAAYKVEFQTIKGTNYKDIFNRFLGNKKNKGLVLKDFYKTYGKDFIIPAYYGQINTDYFYEGEYLIK